MDLVKNLDVDTVGKSNSPNSKDGVAAGASRFKIFYCRHLVLSLTRVKLVQFITHKIIFFYHYFKDGSII